MKIKIGNFNFISDKENKYNLYDNLNDYTKYFYLDGKENTLYVTNMYKFEKQSYYDYERELTEKFKIINIFQKAKEQIQKYINNKVQKIFNNREYSKYELYKELDFGSINSLKYNSKFTFEYEDKIEINFDSNRINFGKFQFNPYTEKVENLDELYEQGVFRKKIKSSIILKEIENEIAPPYIIEIIKINNFIKDKENVNLIFNNMEKFRCRASIGNFLKYYDGVIKIDLEYHERKNFAKANPYKSENDLKINNLVGISYGKNVLEIDRMALSNINMQIAISLEDRLKLRINYLKEDIENQYYKYRDNIKMSVYDVPYTLEESIAYIRKQEKNASSKEELAWYSKELEEIIYKSELINSLTEAKTIEDIKDVCIELGDNELQNIYYGMLYEEENEEENEGEEEEL